MQRLQHTVPNYLAPVQGMCVYKLQNCKWHKAREAYV